MCRNACRRVASPVKDENGRWITSHVINQDIVAWVGQGVIADRSKENLRSSDIGIVMMRQRFFEEMEAVAAGRDPKGVIRDAEVAKCVPLPNVLYKPLVEGVPLEDYSKYPVLGTRLAGFQHHIGQPAAVRAEFEAAMGIGPSKVA